MGIQGLHKAIKPYMERVHISSFSGHRVGCDGFAWLHRGAVSCAQELNTKEPGQRWWELKRQPPPYITFCLRMCSMMQRAGVTPVVVLDGGRLPAKQDTQEGRRSKKAAALEKAKSMLDQGNQAAAEAIFVQTLDVTPEMAHELVRELALRDIEFLVAPYEADPQLAFLSRRDEVDGGIAAVVTEDSDLITYGCQTVLYKLESNGYAEQYSLATLLGPTPPHLTQQLAKGQILSFRCFNMEMLRIVCVLAGCDFLPSVKGMGFKTAHALVKKYKLLKRVLTIMKYEKGLQVPPGYPEAATQALQGFCHPSVFDPRSNTLTRLEPLCDALLDPSNCLDFLGKELPDETARGVAEGRLHPWPPHKPLPLLPQGPNEKTPPKAPMCNKKTWMKQAGGRQRAAGCGRSVQQRAQQLTRSARKAGVRGPDGIPRRINSPNKAPSSSPMALMKMAAGCRVASPAANSPVESIPGDTPPSATCHGRPGGSDADASAQTKSDTIRHAVARLVGRGRVPHPQPQLGKEETRGSHPSEEDGKSPVVRCLGFAGTSQGDSGQSVTTSNAGRNVDPSYDHRPEVPTQFGGSQEGQTGPDATDRSRADAVTAGGHKRMRSASARVPGSKTRKRSSSATEVSNEQRRISSFFAKREAHQNSKAIGDESCRQDHMSVLQQLVDQRASEIGYK